MNYPRDFIVHIYPEESNLTTVTKYSLVIFEYPTTGKFVHQIYNLDLESCVKAIPIGVRVNLNLLSLSDVERFRELAVSRNLRLRDKLRFREVKDSNPIFVDHELDFAQGLLSVLHDSGEKLKNLFGAGTLKMLDHKFIF